MQVPACEYLTWDSEFFDLAIGRIVGDRLPPERADAALTWCRERNIDCLYFLADPSDHETAVQATRLGFILTDTRVQFEIDLAGESIARSGTANVRLALPGDLSTLSSIARTNHRDSRFYFDPNFSEQRCDDFYSTWIERSAQGWADAVFVAEHEGVPAGYVSCHLKESDGSIGLLGVDPRAHRRGLGRALVAAAVRYFQEQGMRRALVVTQGRNLASQRLYERCGFITESVRTWYHLWPEKTGGRAANRMGAAGSVEVPPAVIPFNRTSIAGREYDYIRQAIANGHLSGNGPFTKLAQRSLEALAGSPCALLTTSCTDALEMSALLLRMEPGDEVIVPSFTFVSTVNAFVLRGARPVFADIRRDTLNLDESALERLITPRTRCVLPVHYAGVGCDMDTILTVAGRHGIPVVEDNAHGLFGRYRGRNLGTFGALAALSFHETKNISAGEGGALLINDPAYIERAEILREKGTNRSRFLRGQVDKYTWVDVGSSFLPSELIAAFLCAQLEAAGQIQDARRTVWSRYASALNGWALRNGVQLPHVPDDCEQSYHMFYLLLPDESARDRLIAHLKARHIISVFHYVPLHRSEMGRRWGGPDTSCPVTDDVSARLVRLPFYNSLSSFDQERVIEEVLAFTP